MFPLSRHFSAKKIRLLVMYKMLPFFVSHLVYGLPVLVHPDLALVLVDGLGLVVAVSASLHTYSSSSSASDVPAGRGGRRQVVKGLVEVPGGGLVEKSKFK